MKTIHRCRSQVFWNKFMTRGIHETLSQNLREHVGGESEACSARDLGRDYRAEFFCFFSVAFAEHPVFRLVSEVATELESVLLPGEHAAIGENVIEGLWADVEVSGKLRLGGRSRTGRGGRAWR
jgi:hypothetical protein